MVQNMAQFDLDLTSHEQGLMAQLAPPFIRKCLKLSKTWPKLFFWDFAQKRGLMAQFAIKFFEIHQKWSKGPLEDTGLQLHKSECYQALFSYDCTVGRKQASEAPLVVDLESSRYVMPVSKSHPVCLRILQP